MKKLLLSISFIVCFFAGFSQSIVQRSTGANTLVDPNLFTSRSFRPPVFDDTTAANAVPSLDSTGKIIFTRDVQSFWGRACCPKKWVQVGRNVSFQNSNSISITGTGETNTPYVINANVSQQGDNVVEILGDGLYVKETIVNGRNEGGFITWVSGYTYDVSAVKFAIGGVKYTAPTTRVTLDAAHSTLDRIDVIVANTNGTITVITGVPATNPQEPSVDVQTQLPLGFIFVTHNTVEPVIPQRWIYENFGTNAWNSLSSSARIVENSTLNPYSVPTDIEGTLVQNGDNIRLTDPNPLTITDYNILTFKIFSKAVWANTSKLIFQFYSGASPVGNSISIANNTFGFQSTQTTSYQTISIGRTAFGSLTNVTNLLITASTVAGATIGFYIDDIQLQNSEVPTYGNFHAQGGNVFGATSVIGTNDNFDISFLTNNTQRARILNNGTVLINKTTASALDTGTPIFQVSGKSLITKGIFGSPTIEEGLGTNAVDVYGNMYIGGTSPSVTWNNRTWWFNAESSNGRLLLTSSATGNAYEVQHNRVDGTMMKVLNTVGGTTAFPGITWRFKNTATLTSGAWAETQGETGNYMSVNLTNNASSWIRTLTPFLQYAEIYPVNTSSGVIKRVGVSTDPTSTIDNIETVYRTYRTFYPTGIAAGEVVIGTTTTDNTHILQVTGGVAIDATSTNIRFVGLATDNTATQLAGKNGSGNLVWVDASSLGGVSSITADNGLTKNTSTNVQLGGTLTGNTTINNTSSFSLNITGSNTGNTTGNLYLFNSSASGTAIFGETAGGIVSRMYATTSGTGSTAIPILSIGRGSATAANGIGTILQFKNQTAANGFNSSNTISNEIKSSWDDVTDLTRTSRLIITGVNSGTLADLLTINGSGAYRYNKYGTGAISGTAAFALAVEADGDVIEIALGGGGGGTVNSVAGTINRITSSGGTDPIIDISSSYVGQASITTVGTISTGSWQGSSISTTYTDAKTTSISGTAGRITIGGTATVPVIDISASYVGQSSITTTGDMTSGKLTTGYVIGGVTMTLGSDAAWDMYVRNASGVLQRIPNGTTNQVLIAATGATPVWGSVPVTAGVVSGQGTANQILINGTTGSAQTGALVFTLPQDIHTSAIPTFRGQLYTGGSAGTTVIGISSTATSTIISNAGDIFPLAGADASIYESTGNVVAEPGSGTAQVYSTMTLNGLTVIPGGGSVVNTATLWIKGIANAIVSGENYGIWVDVGNLRLDAVGGNAGRYIVADVNGVLQAGFNRTRQTLVDGATIVWNVTSGGNAVVTLNGTGRTLLLQNAVAGETYTIEIIQGSGGSKTITTWPTGSTWSGSNTLSTAAGDVDVVTLYYNGTSFRNVLALDFN